MAHAPAPSLARLAALVILAAAGTGCQRGFSTSKEAKATGKSVVATEADIAFAPAEDVLSIEPDAHPEEIEPAGRDSAEDADAAHGKWAAGAKDRGLNLAGLGGPTVREASVPLASLDTDTDVPLWTRKELVAGFARLRDVMLAKADGAGNARRLTWLFPDDGCYARAALGGYLLEKAGYKRPYNVFSFGNLSARTANHPQGFINWRYHVAPVVEVDGVAYVLDPAIEPLRPLTLRGWLDRQSAKVASLKVALCDSGSMSPNNLCMGAADPARAAVGYIQQSFFGLEFARQKALGRDPALVLGASPPWTVPACVPTTPGNLVIKVAAARADEAVCVNGTEIAAKGATRPFATAALCADRDTFFKVDFCAGKAPVTIGTRAGASVELTLP